MKAGKNLYGLINSLSKSEKRNFRKYAKRHVIGEKNIYLRLFDEINKQKSTADIDEQQLKLRLKKYSRISNFSVLKSYLHDMILKSMRVNDAEDNIDASIQKNIDNYRLLLKKSLLRECKDELMKAKKTAAKYEKFDKLYDIIRKEGVLIKRTEPANVEKFQILNKELLDTAEKIKNHAEYINLNSISVSMSSKLGVTDIHALKKEFEKILSNELLQDIGHAHTFYSRLYYYQIHSYYYFIISEYGKALFFFEKMGELYETQPDMIRENTRNYFICLQNCLEACDILRSDNDYRFYYGKLADAMQKYKLTPGAKYRVLSRTYIHEVRRYTTRGDFNENNPQIKTVRAELEKNAVKFPAEERLILIFQLTMYYFGCRNYSESLKWLNIIINREEELRKDLRIECRLLFLIIHYELGNYDLLEYAVKSIYRYLRKQKTLQGLEPLLLSFIRKSAGAATRAELIELFRELKESLLAGKDRMKDYAFNYAAWVESKISGVKFSEVVRQEYEGFPKKNAIAST